MNAKQWNTSTNKEKAEYLLDSEIVIKSRTGMRANAKINDPNPCVTVWTGHAGIVQITGHCETSIEAAEQCIESLNDWRKELNQCK